MHTLDLQKIPYAQHSSMTSYPGMLACFLTNHSLLNRIQWYYTVNMRFSNLYLLLFTVHSGFVFVVLTVMAVLSFAWLSRYANMLAIILLL